MSLLQENKVPKDVYQAFNNLRNDANFKVIIDFFKKALESEDSDNRTYFEDVHLRWGQGHSQVLNFIIQTNNNAYDILTKLMAMKK